MAERNEIRSNGGLWLERIAWNAAALAALAVMLLVLLGTFEWLDHVSGRAPEAQHDVRAMRASTEAERRTRG